MPTIHVYGIDHSRAPLEVREELAFSEAELNEVLPMFLTQGKAPQHGGHVREVMLISTCNRTEVYLVTEGKLDFYPLEPIRLYRPRARAMDDLCLRYHLQDSHVSAHLFAVAAALRSEVPGDTQIATQVAGAARASRNAGTLGPVLEHLVAGALRSAKRVRRETGLAAGSSGIGPAVLRNLRRLAPLPARHPKSVQVLLLGAGTMAEEVATHLLRSGTRSGLPGRPEAASAEIAIAGVWARDKQKAIRFSTRFGVPSSSTQEAAKLLTHVDAVVGACRGRVPLLSERVLSPLLATRVEPLLVLDLGVPRNLDPILAQRDGLQAIFLDQLHQQMRERTRIRKDALARAEHIAAEEAARFATWWLQWPLRPIRAEVYASLETVLAKWRSTQPGAVRHLRVALHRTLETAFGTASAVFPRNLAIDQ